MSTNRPSSDSKSHCAAPLSGRRLARHATRKLKAGLPLLLSGIFGLSLSACSDAPTPGAGPTGLHVQDAYMKRAVPGRKMTAAYATLINYSPETLCFIGYNADFAASIELHVTEPVGGPDSQRVAMRRIRELCIAPGERVTLEPGGKHLMIMGLDADALPAAPPQTSASKRATYPITHLRLGTRSGRLFEAEFAVVPFNYSAQNL